MDWQHIARTDAFLAGSIAGRAWNWWDETTAESQADSIGLTGDRRADFLRGWQDEIAEQELERKEQFFADYDAMAAGHEKGDPAR